MGNYKLLVADACSDIRFYNIFNGPSLLLCSSEKSRHIKKITGLSEYLYIVLMANIIQITILVLIIYHCGKTAGQSFSHDYSCFMVCAIILASVLLLSNLVKLLLKLSRPLIPNNMQ